MTSQTDLGVMQHEAKAQAELQLTVQWLDQMWNIEVLKGAYEGKVVGIRLYRCVRGMYLEMALPIVSKRLTTQLHFNI